MKPNDEINILIQKANRYREQANNQLSSGLHSNEAGLLGEFFVQEFVPYGLKSFMRKTGSIGQKTSKKEVKTQWRNLGNQVLSECESTVREMSLNTKNLTISGNSQKLLRKFNRVKKIKNPVPFFDNLISVLQEYQNLDLIWNKDIEEILSKRKIIKNIERYEKEHLKINSKDIIKKLQDLDSTGATLLHNILEYHPLVLKSMLGALDRLRENSPDAERHCITSCRASIEILCTNLGKEKDWKNGLNKIFSSKTDRRQVKNVWNFLSGKGAHGGHNPSKKEAEYAFRLTSATLKFILNEKSEI